MDLLDVKIKFKKKKFEWRKGNLYIWLCYVWAILITKQTLVKYTHVGHIGKIFFQGRKLGRKVCFNIGGSIGGWIFGFVFGEIEFTVYVYTLSQAGGNGRVYSQLVPKLRKGRGS